VSNRDVCYKPCKKGTYEDKALQSCYKCPPKYKRTSGSSPLNPNACTKRETRSADLVTLKKDGKMLSVEKTRDLVNKAKEKVVKALVEEEVE